jgi:glycosyltransferase involved in cell wall biosynthesis
VSAPWPRVRRALAELEPDLLATSNLPGFGSGIWECARELGVPVAHTLHDYHLLCPRTSLLRRDGTPCRPDPRLCGLRTRRLMRWAPAVGAVIAGSQYLLEAHRGWFAGADRHVIRLPLVAAPSDRPLPARPLVAGFLGALTTTKGVRLLIEAAPALAAAGIALKVAGEGPLAAELAAAPSLEWVGRVDGAEKSAFIAGCDIGLVPSTWAEPSGPPYVVLEWLAAGRPVLCTTGGGLGEAVGLGGVRAVEPSATGLVDALRGLTAGPDWAELVQALPRVEGDSDVERWLDEHEAAFAAVIARGVAR